jgi:ubiquinone/menaquinone biosynthesis C-methylase UbiE
LIARARERAKQGGNSLQFEVANAQDLPFSDNSFDVIFSLFSIKHWLDPMQGIGECWRVLKTGGELLLVDTTSDAGREQVTSIIERMGFPRLLQEPAARFVYQRLIRPSCPMETYRQISTELGMPAGTVSQLSYIPAFLFRTQKPEA